ncbi:ThuA domain-containing protein [Luteolibacter marinus]|uniref:ThuA domain-containing protein n=1 Tax=Luteolibacter marinus TaxID=2776705 RepID=UPI001867F777|nr:ThuA domain-containing protein [Luteolibacter marinus]
MTVALALASPGTAEEGPGLPASVLATGDPSPRPREILFLGRQVNGHHNPGAFHSLMRLPWAERDLKITFTTQLTDMNAAKLGQHDALFIYGNAFSYISGDQEEAIKRYADGGGGVAAMHVACWSSPPANTVTSVIGGAFLGHYAIQEFTQVILEVDHPILKGLGTYTSVDEPYQFQNLATDRTILTVRPGPGPETEMTWVRLQGLGRVFYHSGGHDARTWVQPNFQELVTRGIEWVAKDGGGPAITGLGKARIGGGGAIAVRATLAGTAEKQAVLTRLGDRWHRTVLEGETLYDLGSGTHAPSADDPLRVGGEAAMPVIAMQSGFVDSVQIPRCGWWTGRGGLVRSLAREGADLSWGSGFLTVAAVPEGVVPELVMNAGGTAVAQLFVASGSSPEPDTALVEAAGGTAAVLVAEGEVLDDSGSPWTCGDLRTARLSLNNGGWLAAMLPDAGGGQALVSRVADEWLFLLKTGSGVPGLPVAGTVTELRDVRLNDAGDLIAAVRLGSDGALLRRSASGGEWSVVLRDGGQPWLAAAEALVLPADGKGTLVDAGGTVWQRAGVDDGVEVTACLVKVTPDGTAAMLCREGGPLALGGETVTLDSLAGPDAWSCGPAGMACGRLTVTPAEGLAREVLVREVLVRWNGRHAMPVVEAGADFLTSDGPLEAAGFLVDGGGTSEDGKGGFMTAEGQWVATVIETGGSAHLIHGCAIADLDGDGRDDSLEEALGGNPVVADPGTQLLGIEPVPAGAALVFLRRIGGPFEYRVETCGDLGDWQASAAEPQVAANQDGVPAGYQRMALPLAGERGFARIRVSTD